MVANQKTIIKKSKFICLLKTVDTEAAVRDFLATKTHLDNFLFLESNFHNKVMYSYSLTPDVSDRDGKMLDPTLAEAKEKELINNNKTLRKQYIVYDVFGNKEISANSSDDVIRQLSNKIQLTSKFVHKDEIKRWNPNVKQSWGLTISDGRYTVYRIENPNSPGKFIYYPSQDLALAAVKTTAKLNSDVNVLEKSQYLYNYTTTQSEVIPFIFYDDVNTVIDKIYKLEHWN